MQKNFAKPFIKWVGGKRQLIGTFIDLFPIELFEGKIDTYIEPFVGGGALLFYLLQNYKIKKIIINDINRELINCYYCIKKDVQNVIKCLKKIENEYLSSENKDEYYYNMRKKYNFNSLEEKNKIEKCCELIFLNKTCFNGLYRVNSLGHFNVPHGKYKKPLICDSNNLKLCSHLLKNVDIYCGDYKKVLNEINTKTFVYFDPPYKPILNNNSFVNYNALGFDDDEQIRLATFFKKLNNKKCFLMLSNSDPKNTDNTNNFFDELYKNFDIKRVFAKRVVNSNPSKRGNITEIVVRNY